MNKQPRLPPERAFQASASAKLDMETRAARSLARSCQTRPFHSITCRIIQSRRLQERSVVPPHSLTRRLPSSQIVHVAAAVLIRDGDFDRLGPGGHERTTGGSVSSLNGLLERKSRSPVSPSFRSCRTGERASWGRARARGGWLPWLIRLFTMPGTAADGGRRGIKATRSKKGERRRIIARTKGMEPAKLGSPVKLLESQ